MRSTTTIPLLLLAATLTACTPLTVSFTLFAKDKKLVESVVDEDSNASWKVCVIDVQGLIVDAPLPGLLGPGANPVDEVVARLDRARTDASIRAVVLRINSPGGSVTGSDVLYREIRRFRELSNKPVVVSMAEVAASGGYYIALAADRILANPTTITGSIGVIVPTINFSDGLSRIGIVARSVKSGPNKDIANSLEPMKDSHYRVLQGLVDEYYAAFRQHVKDRRPNLDLARFDESTDGRIMSGREALARGLVDQLGGIREAFDAAKELAGIQAAKMVKFRLEGAAVPRTAYADASVDLPTTPAASNPGTEVNLLRIDASGFFPHAGPAPSSFYYLWMANEP
ncbi:MAG: signal peptide peptidase SppA [Phycisphaerales bacterium]|nr:signal peptide peptidase SppA [Phycisphaerales bacterium]